MTEKLTVSEELELFAIAYHNMKTLDIDQSVLDDLVEDFSTQFEFCEEEEPEEIEKPYRVFMVRQPAFRWGEGEDYEFATREDAIAKIIDVYKDIPTLAMSRNASDYNYWGKTYLVRKVTN